MKIVINSCFGGFSLSPAGVRRLAELNGRECYFFTNRAPDGSFNFEKNYPIDEKDTSELVWSAFDVPNPDELIGVAKKGEDGTYKDFNEVYNKHNLTSRPEDRADPKLIQVVEELGGDRRKGASGDCAALRIVEIPDGIEWEIDEYDGDESIEEVHQSWR